MSRTPNPVDQHIGRRIAFRREELKMSQSDLGREIGPVSFQQVQKYESGANRISGSRMFEAAKAMGVEVGYFYEGLTTEDVRAAQAPSTLHTAAGRRALRALEGLKPNQLAAVADLVESLREAA
jgi:transcriptional regulator with XRE-family HTH domain